MPQRNSRRRKSRVHRNRRDQFNVNAIMGPPPPPAPRLMSEMSQPYYTGMVGPDGKPEDFWRGKPPGRFGYGKNGKNGKKSKKRSSKSKKSVKKSKKRSAKKSKKRSTKRSNRR